jgi:hypothetical protein
MGRPFDIFTGIIAIWCGIYGLLFSYRILPRNPKDPERTELIHRKFGKLMRILYPIIILFGILHIFGVFSWIGELGRK